MIDPARRVVVYRRVWRREPLSNLLLYLVPYSRDSVFIMEEMKIKYYEHFISSTLFAISSTLLALALLAFLASGRTVVQRNIAGWWEAVPTIFVLNSGFHRFGDGHEDLLLYQGFQPLQRLLNIFPSQ
jgi:hypothetical protein